MYNTVTSFKNKPFRPCPISRYELPSKAKTRVQSFFMLITIQPLRRLAVMAGPRPGHPWFGRARGS